MTERRALCAQAEQRARAGEAPMVTCTVLNLSITTYYRWAALFGFRLSDLDPDHARGRGQHAAGSRLDHGEGKGPTGRFMLERGTGGKVAGSGRPPAVDLAALGLETAAQVLDAVRAALARGEVGAGDRLLSAWRARMRREAGLAMLEGLAAQEAAGAGVLAQDWRPGDMVSLAQIEAMDGDMRRRHVCALVGKPGVAGADDAASVAGEDWADDSG